MLAMTDFPSTQIKMDKTSRIVIKYGKEPVSNGYQRLESLNNEYGGFNTFLMYVGGREAHETCCAVNRLRLSYLSIFTCTTVLSFGLLLVIPKTSFNSCFPSLG